MDRSFPQGKKQKSQKTSIAKYVQKTSLQMQYPVV
jgi:hypothetical protein